MYFLDLTRRNRQRDCTKSSLVKKFERAEVVARSLGTPIAEYIEVDPHVRTGIYRRAGALQAKVAMERIYKLWIGLNRIDAVHLT